MPAGRPSKLTPEVERKLLQLIQAGVPKKRAAEACGIGETTFGDHQRKNRDFRAAVEKAYAECVASKVLTIAKAEKEGTWTAAAWWLERRERAEFGRVDRHELTGKDGEAIEHKVGVLFYLPETDAEDPEEAMLARVAAEEE